MKKMVSWFYTLLACMFFILPIFKYTMNQVIYWNHPGLSLTEKFNTLDNTFFKNLIFIQTLASNKHILTFDQSLVYRYTKALFIPYLDRKLLPVYSAKTKKEVYQLLKNMNVDYVDTFFIEPVLINTKLMDMLNDPRYAHLIFQSYKKVYKLNEEIKKIKYYPIEITPVHALKDFYPFKKINQKTKFFHQIKHISLPLISLPYRFDQNMSKNNIFQLNHTISGIGYYKVLCNEYSENHSLIKSSIIFEDVLNNQTRVRSAQFLLNPATKKINFVYELNGVGEMTLKDIELRSFSKWNGLKNWYLMRYYLTKNKQIDLQRDQNLFFLHSIKHGVKLSDAGLKNFIIVHKKNFQSIHAIDFFAKGQGDLNVYLIQDNQIKEKVNKSDIHLHEHYQDYHFLISPKLSNYHIGFQRMNSKKSDDFSIKFFKYE